MNQRWPILLLLVACSSEQETTLAQAVCPPGNTFQHAVCVCDNLAQVGALFAKTGPSGVGSVGINGRTDLVGYSESSGDWISYKGFAAVGAAIGESLFTEGDFHSAGDIQIAKDVAVGGDLTCLGRLDVGGSLAVGGDERVIGFKDVASRKAYSSAGGPPCNCDPATFFDVDAAVAAAASATGGKTSWDHIGKSEIHLTGGNYYVTSADVIGLTRIYVDAPSSVFVDGSLRQIGAEQWKIAPGAQLDLFVSGDVLSVGQLIAGSKTDPAAFRLYIGGDGKSTVGAVGDTHFYGSVYAPRAAIAYVGNAEIVGAIFAKTILGVGLLTIEYGAPITPPTSCDPPPAGTDGSDPVFF